MDASIVNPGHYIKELSAMIINERSLLEVIIGIMTSNNDLACVCLFLYIKATISNNISFIEIAW